MSAHNDITRITWILLMIQSLSNILYKHKKIILISIFLYTLQISTKSTTIINSTWTDDFTFDDENGFVGINGWNMYQFLNLNASKQYSPANKISLGDAGKQYHGPFTRLSGGTRSNYLRRQFKCDTGTALSDVYMFYSIAYCGTQNDDYTRLCQINSDITLNNKSSDVCRLGGVSADIMDATNITLGAALTDSTFITNVAADTGNCANWRYQVKTVKMTKDGYNNVGWNTSLTFDIAMKQAVGNNEYSVAYDISIQCIGITEEPTTAIPTTAIPTTAIPTSPTTAIPTTAIPTTSIPTTAIPTTAIPTTSNPTTTEPTFNPTTSLPTSTSPTTNNPTTSMPTTLNPTTAEPTTAVPTSASPTTNNPTTSLPTSTAPTTDNPTTSMPTTSNPTTANPTSSMPTSSNPTTSIPTTSMPSSSNPTTSEPTTISPTTTNPTTAIPTSLNPTTSGPTTSNPTTSSPTTANPTTSIPTTTMSTTTNPTTGQPTKAPITADPTTSKPTTAIPTTSNPTSSISTSASPTTLQPTFNPITAIPTTSIPTSISPTTIHPTSSSPTSSSPTTSNPTTNIPTTNIPTTNIPTTNIPTTNIPTTTKPTSSAPSTSEPTTISPTSNPNTHRPTTARPTEACNINNAISAEWSPSYLSIYIYVPYKHNKNQYLVDNIIIDETAMINDCSSIFSNTTMNLLGNDAECFWIKNKNQAILREIDEDSVLVIDLAPTSTINQTDSLIFLDRNNGPIKYLCTLTDEYSDVIIPSIDRPLNPIPPNILLSGVSTAIGTCDSLLLDARSTTYMGGRDNDIHAFEWSITRITAKRTNTNIYYGSYVEIAYKLLAKLQLYDIKLTVTNWYNETSTHIFDVYVSDQATPKVSLSGTYVYRATRVNLAGYIEVYSTIGFNKRCLQNALTVPTAEYTISWSVSVSKLYNDTSVIDTGLLDKLNVYLADYYDNIDAIAVYVDDYMQPGMEYVFTMNLQCIGDYDCNIDTTHRLIYDYSSLKCAIKNSDMNIYDVDVILDKLNEVQLNLDGYRFTWDPDKLEKKLKVSKRHLIWTWDVINCQQTVDNVELYANQSCQNVIDLYNIDTFSGSELLLDFGLYDWKYSASYSFEFVMEVYDSNNLGRDSCFDAFTLTITTSTSPPTTAIPTTGLPTTTTAPTTAIPTTSNPTTTEPTFHPTTSLPTSTSPTTDNPTTSMPTTLNPTTANPTSSMPTSSNPTTSIPTTSMPSSSNPTTSEPTTISPTTTNPTTIPTTTDPTTGQPTKAPITANPTTSKPTAAQPTTAMPTTSNPTTSNPTTSMPSSSNPTTAIPTSLNPTTSKPTTSNPTTTNPTTANPTTSMPTSSNPTTTNPTTAIPTSLNPTTSEPTTSNPTRSPFIEPTASPITASPTRGTGINREKLFIVEVTAIRTSISAQDRVGLIGDVINYDVATLENMYYFWSELNGLLTDTEIENYKENVYENSLNLILQQNVLKPGEIYTFQLIVEQYEYPLTETQRRRRLETTNNERIGYGASTGVDIYIFKAPTKRSFKIEPSCINTYESISELITATHTLTISADDDNVPLVYQFGYNEYSDNDIQHHFHPSLLSEASLHNVYLPPISNFTIFGNVINSIQSVSTQYIECSVVLLNYSECIIDWKQDIIDTYIDGKSDDPAFLADDNDKYEYIFSQTNIYLKYLRDDYIPNSNHDSCIEEAIKQVLETLDEYINNNNTCSTSKWTIALSETMVFLMNLISPNDPDLAHIFYVNDGDNNYLSIIQELLTINLDPCGCIDGFSDVEELYLNEDSMITQIPSIYYEGNEITGCLTPIISDPYYHDSLYSMVKPMVTLIGSIPYNESIDLYNLLLDSIYIAELTLISTAIPGTKICSDTNDEFVSCTMRVATDCDGNNITLNIGAVTVDIPNNATCNAPTTDIVVVGMEDTTINVNDGDAANVDVPIDNECDSKVVDNTLSITILSGNKSNDTTDDDDGNTFDPSQLSDNVVFAIPCDEGICDTSYECVWFDKVVNIWKNTGCDTIIDVNLNGGSYICSCSHLTAFATIHNIHDICNNPFVAEWLESDVWDIFLWIFFAIFLCIFIYAMFCCCYYHIYYHWQHINLCVIFLIGITALLYALVCLLGYYTKLALLSADDDANTDESIIKLYTLFLLLPQATYFMIFTIIFFQWFCLVHSLFLPDVDTLKKQNYLKWISIGLNIFLWIFLLIFYILVFNTGYPSNHDIFINGTIFWSILITLVCIIFVIYAYLLSKTFSKVSKPKNTAHGTFRLLLITSFIALYFIFLAITSIYFAVDPSEHQTIAYTIIYYIVDIIFLLFLLFMYREYLYENNKRSSHELDLKIIANALSIDDEPKDGEIEMGVTGGTAITPQDTEDSEEAVLIPQPASDANSLKVVKCKLDLHSSSAPTPDTNTKKKKKRKDSKQERPSTPLLTGTMDEYEDRMILIDYQKNANDEEEAAKWKAMEEEQERQRIKQKEELEREQREEEEMKRKQAAAEVARLKAEQERKRKEAEQAEAARLKAVDEERKRQEAEHEEQRLRHLEEEKKRKEAEAEVARLKAIEAVRLKAEIEEKKRKEAEEEMMRLKAIAAAREKAEEEEKKRKAAEAEAARLRAEAEERKKKEAEDAEIARLKALEEEERKQKENEEAAEEEKEEEKDEESDSDFLSDSDFDDDDEEEDEEKLEEIKKQREREKISNLIKRVKELPANIADKGLGNLSKYRMPKRDKDLSRLELEMKKLMILNEDDPDQRVYAKLAILRYYDVLIETFIKYCKIGGDRYWLTIKGWDALYRDAFISDKKLIGKCTNKECHQLFYKIYEKYNNPLSNHKLKRKQTKRSCLMLSEWNDEDPWTGIWKQQDGDSNETYKIKQIGGTKLSGFIKSFEFCDINGTVKGHKNKNKGEMMIFWHCGPRKNKRRFCKCTLNKPSSLTEPVTMTVKWEAIATSSIVDEINKEKGVYTMVKMKKGLDIKDFDLFKDRIGLARHEYIDAMLTISQMRFGSDLTKKYEKVLKICIDHLIPYIFGGTDGAQEATIKSIFRPYSTELHKLFQIYCCLDKSDHSDDKLLGDIEWIVLCQNIFKFGISNLKDSKPNERDICSSFELAKQGYDLELTYKGFERALQNLATKIYKKKPKSSYKSDIKYQEKLKKLLKGCQKLQKSGHKPSIKVNK